MSEQQSLKEYTIFTYSTVHLAKKDKVRFYYALKGRDGKKGIVKKYSINQLGRTVLLVDTKHEKNLQEFFKYWKCNYNTMNVFREE